MERAPDEISLKFLTNILAMMNYNSGRERVMLTRKDISLPILGKEMHMETDVGLMDTEECILVARAKEVGVAIMDIISCLTVL